MTKKQRKLPYEIFLIASWSEIPLTDISQELDLSLKDIFVLSYIKHFGKEVEGRKAVLRENMTDLLKRVFKISDSTAARHINKLRDKDFLSGPRLKPEQMKQMSNEVGIRTTALVLEEKGSKIIDEFTGKVSHLFLKLINNLSDSSFSSFSKALEQFGNDVTL